MRMGDDLYVPLRQVLLWPLGFRLTSTAAGVAMLACNSAIMRQSGAWEHAGQKHRTLLDVLAVDVSFSVCCGWLSLCLLVNVAEICAEYGLDLPREVGLAAGAAVCMMALIARTDPVYPLAFMWSYWDLQSRDQSDLHSQGWLWSSVVCSVAVVDVAVALIIVSRLCRFARTRRSSKPRDGGLLQLASPV
jgi:hypothetical protein